MKRRQTVTLCGQRKRNSDRPFAHMQFRYKEYNTTERFHVTSHVQTRSPFWCTALNFIEAGLPPYEAAVKHRYRVG